MGKLLQALNLRPPRHMREAALAGGADEIELVQTDEAVWDPREVSEDEAAAWIAGGGATPSRPAPPQEPSADAAAGSALLIPVSLSVPIGKKFKYVEIEKLKIEGELKLAAIGTEGVLKSADVIGVSLDKGKLSPAKKFEIDLKKLKDLVLGDLQTHAQGTGLQVDAKLEVKVGPQELKVALGLGVSSGWYTGATKFVAVAKEQGKAFEFANFELQPIGCQVKPRPFEIAGAKGLVSGKLTVTLILKPAWGAIAVDVGQKVARPVLTTMAEVLTAELAITAGFVAGAAAQIFAYAKSVSEWQDVRACAQAAERGWLSFRAGFGAVYGVRWNDGGAATLRQAGAGAATALQQLRLKTARERVRSEHGRLPPDFDVDYLATLREKVAQNPDGLGLWVEKSFRRQILDGFLAAYEKEHRDDYQFKPNYRALRTLLGVAS